MSSPAPAHPSGGEIRSSQATSEVDALWLTREAYWRRKLGRVRLGVEPVQDQLARIRRVTWSLTVVPGLLAVVFVLLFASFARADLGLILVSVLLLPIILGAWFDYLNLRRHVRRYQAERSAYRKEKERVRASTASESDPRR